MGVGLRAGSKRSALVVAVVSLLLSCAVTAFAYAEESPRDAGSGVSALVAGAEQEGIASGASGAADCEAELGVTATDGMTTDGIGTVTRTETTTGSDGDEGGDSSATGSTEAPSDCADASSEDVTEDKSMPVVDDASASLVVQESGATYKITYKLKGGKNNPKNPKTYVSGAKKITLAKPTRAGYKFQGWYADASCKKRVRAIAKSSKGNVTLYAKWTMIGYKITYKLRGGKNNAKNPASYTSKSGKITLKKARRKGYTFAGWYRDAKCTKRVRAIAKGSKGKLTLYAKWVANKYNVWFDANGATSGYMHPMSKLKYGKKYKLKKNGFVRTGYGFVGWNTRADGTGKTYRNRAKIKNLTSKKNGHVTLYAQWVPYVTCSYLGMTDYGGVATVTNRCNRIMSVTVDFLYYSGSTLAETSSDYEYCLEPGHTCALRGWTTNATNYTSCQVKCTYKLASDSIGGNVSYISYSSNPGNKNVMVTVSNNGNTVQFTQVAVVFYKDGEVVGYERHFADVDSAGSSDYLQFDFPHTRNYSTIYPDKYQVFINSSYGYSW